MYIILNFVFVVISFVRVHDSKTEKIQRFKQLTVALKNLGRTKSNQNYCQQLATEKVKVK